MKETSFSPGIVCFFDVQNKKNDSFARVLDTKEVALTRVNQIEKRCESCINNKWSFRDNEKTRRIEVNWDDDGDDDDNDDDDDDNDY